jgi:hypothetical protein
VGAAVFLTAGATGLVVQHQHRVRDEAAANDPLAFAGFATPEAGFKSSFAAMNRGDLKALMESLTPEFRDKFLATTAKSNSEAQLSASYKQAAAMIGNYRIESKEVVSDDEMILHIRSPRILYGAVPMKKVDGQWKVNGNLVDQRPKR